MTEPQDTAAPSAAVDPEEQAKIDQESAADAARNADSNDANTNESTNDVDHE
jgi:hypothetical protein